MAAPVKYIRASNMLQDVLSFPALSENHFVFFFNIYIFCCWAQSAALTAPGLTAEDMVLVSS